MSFSSDMAKWAQKTNRSIERTIIDATIDISSEIIARTPVDSGRLRGNWIPSVGSPMIEELESTSPNIDGVRREASKSVGNVFYLVNSLPYVRRIEYEEWSKVKAPQGMVRISVQNWTTALKEAIK